GPLYYSVGVLAVGFAPGSVFLGLAGWYATGRRAREELPRATLPLLAATVRERAASDTRSLTVAASGGSVADSSTCLPATYRFLWCWFAVYFVFFSLAGTKLPNYILPVYPPLAILTARFLQRWRIGTIQPPASA